MKNMYKVACAVLCMGLSLTGLFAAGSKEATPSTPSAAAPVAKTIVKEAPILAAQVASGALVKLEDRLPVQKDVMIADMESLGAYG
ncbi:MAG: hypothetical protein VB056_14505, partial [Sphaerochaeta associata]